MQLPADTVATLVCLTLAGALPGCSGDPVETAFGRLAIRAPSGTHLAVRDLDRSLETLSERPGLIALSVAIVNDGQVVYTHTTAGPGHPRPAASEEPVFPAGALSRSLFAFLVLRLAGAGVLDLDQPLSTYLTRSLALYPRFAGLAADERHRAITARMVLSETTGLARSDPAVGASAFLAPPGTTFGHSSLGYEYLQFVIERITARSLDSLSGEQIFLPSGMLHTSFLARPQLAGPVLSRLEIVPRAGPIHDDFDASGAGSLLTTATDYARFLARLAERPDLASLRDELWHPHTLVSPPDETAEAGPASPRELSWCLGWGRYLSPRGEVRFQSGCRNGCASFAAIYVEQRVGLVVLVAGADSGAVLRDAAAAVLGDDAMPPDQPAS